jgi:very-short-patch-repair endonuclease
VGVDVHDLHKEEDERREKVLREMGLRVVRFRNDEVLRNLSAVVGKIKSCIIGSGDFTYDKSRTP